MIGTASRNRFLKLQVESSNKFFKWGDSSVGRAGKNENILCIFSSPNDEIVNTKVTSKFHEKDRVVSSSLTLPTNAPLVEWQTRMAKDHVSPGSTPGWGT